MVHVRSRDRGGSSRPAKSRCSSTISAACATIWRRAPPGRRIRVRGRSPDRHVGGGRSSCVHQRAGPVNAHAAGVVAHADRRLARSSDARVPAAALSCRPCRHDARDLHRGDGDRAHRAAQESPGCGPLSGLCARRGSCWRCDRWRTFVGGVRAPRGGAPELTRSRPAGGVYGGGLVAHGGISGAGWCCCKSASMASLVFSVLALTPDRGAAELLYSQPMPRRPSS